MGGFFQWTAFFLSEGNFISGRHAQHIARQKMVVQIRYRLCFMALNNFSLEPCFNDITDLQLAGSIFTTYLSGIGGANFQSFYTNDLRLKLFGLNFGHIKKIRTNSPFENA